MTAKTYSARKRVLFVLLRIARAMGGFAVARWWTRNDLRILAYHGVELADEAAFRGGLFISEAVFRRRLEHLASAGYPVLPLGEALELLQRDGLPHRATVVTIDDGWRGTASIMAPLLQQYGFPATLYLSTYYVQTQTQVFNVAVDYVLWKSQCTALNLQSVDASLSGFENPTDSDARARLTRTLCALADGLPSAECRQQLLRRVASAAGVDLAALERQRVMSYMTAAEAAELHESGIDVQLHTHRHRLPADSAEAMGREIADNRKALDGIANSDLVHFCFPSGEYVGCQLPWLQALGIRSATTVRSGFNTRRTPMLELLRFVDWDQITDIEFEAEMSGILELVRRCGYSI